MHMAASLALSTLFCLAVAAPEHRHIERGVTRANVARLDRGTKWQASDGLPGTYDAARLVQQWLWP